MPSLPLLFSADSFAIYFFHVSSPSIHHTCCCISVSFSLCLPPSLCGCRHLTPPIRFHLWHPRPSPRSRWRFECHCSLEVLTYIEILDSAHGELVRMWNAMHFAIGVRRSVEKWDIRQDAEATLTRAALQTNKRRGYGVNMKWVRVQLHEVDSDTG